MNRLKQSNYLNKIVLAIPQNKTNAQKRHKSYVDPLPNKVYEFLVNK